MAHFSSIFANQNGVEPAILALADGTVFRGRSIGAAGHSTAEIVFNTSMAGYQEIITDPGYTQQIITLTYPHVGNSGINSEDAESAQVHAAGFVIRSCPVRYSNFRAEQSLPDYLKANGVVAISDIDTRKLARILRDGGAQSACIMVGDDEAKAIALAKEHAGLKGQDLVKTVTRQAPEQWVQTSWQLDAGYGELSDPTYHVVAYDFGVKNSFLRLLADRKCRVTVVPADTSVEDVLALNPDGVFLSNGPGDPSACHYAIENTKQLLDKTIPLFGIGLGYQILALATGAQTSKMKIGNHGVNHPVKDLESGRVHITVQNHNYVVDADSLATSVQPTHISLFDGSLQGIKLSDHPAFGFQGHPEATTAPNDNVALFDQFINLMAEK
ncbi:MAG: glutamine-hydrolyzing carbamoyl-phosphate synthase small subunit [Alcaligenaceae bacterium]|nr:glutamine-hydrolyzing carbamoyl-phosphate synthase small subunit [Alcaligenaceae bacterium]HZJ96324.1 glutamine-hydrolyzing carbamoyl-phosphate synthase small subunit [Oligella sp.]